MSKLCWYMAQLTNVNFNETENKVSNTRAVTHWSARKFQNFHPKQFQSESFNQKTRICPQNQKKTTPLFIQTISINFSSPYLQTPLKREENFPWIQNFHSVSPSSESDRSEKNGFNAKCGRIKLLEVILIFNHRFRKISCRKEVLC